MRKDILVASGICFGAGLMYVLDPERGKRRRAMLRDRAAHGFNLTRVTLDKRARDVSNRARGLAAEAGAALRCEPVSNHVLEERVRSQMGRVVSEPGDVEVLVDEGEVTLRGVVRSGEIERLLRRVSGVRGVRSVESQLSVKGLHAGEHVNGGANGKGGASRRHERPSVPARLLATVAGGGLALYGARRRGVVGSVVSVVGMGMLRRGLLPSVPHSGNGANGTAAG